MKKTLILVIAIVAIFYFNSYAQTWSGSTPGNIYYNSGNVGIGTSTPTASLDIQTSNSQFANFQSTSPTSRLFQTFTNTGSGYIGREGSAGGQIMVAGLPYSFVLGNQTSHALQLGTNNVAQFTIDPTGNVGIGTTSPSQRLDVNGSTRSNTFFASGSAEGLRIIDDNGYISCYDHTNNIRNGYVQIANGNLNIQSETGSKNIHLNPSGGSVGIGTTTPIAKLTVSGGDVLLDNSGWYSSKTTTGVTVPISGIEPDNQMYFGDLFGNLPSNNFYVRTNGQNRMAINSSGNVGIGTTSPDEKLTVNGTIHSTEVKVNLSVPAPDYVFDNDYDLKSLADIQQYIIKNKHLPEVPSAGDMAKDGLKVGEMNMILLKKVEELTLYAIENDKQIAGQQKKNEEQKQHNIQQQKQIDQLQQQVDLLIKVMNKN